MRNVNNLFMYLLIIVFSTTLAAQEKSSSTNDLLPAGEENARAALDKSPRHGEWLDVSYEGKSIRSWIVYPERKDKAPVIIIIHEIFGLSDWIRSVADQLAKEGYIAIAPDLISGFGPNGGGSESVSSRDSVVMLIRNLTAEETYKRLNAIRSYAIKLPAANGKYATVGFCWGGGRSFGYACVQSDVSAAIVYYGTSPDAKELATLNAPVLGLYGGDDARVGATVEPASVEIKKLGQGMDFYAHKATATAQIFVRQKKPGRECSSFSGSIFEKTRRE
jgi:carboxymethylenebutenolidase